MPQVTQRIPRSRAQLRLSVSRLARSIRTRKEAWDSQEIAHLRRLVRAYGSSASPPRLLYLGDSLTLFPDAHDTDRRRIPEMVAAETGLEKELFTVRGGSYGPGLFNAYLDVLTDLPAKPEVLIVPLSIRLRLLPWTHHPRYEFGPEIQAIRQFGPRTPWYRIRSPRPPPDHAAASRYEELVYRTRFDDERTIGSFRNVLLAQTSNADEYVRSLYNFHNGGFVKDDDTIGQVKDLRAKLDALELPVIAYQTPVNDDFGSYLLGPEFRVHTRENREALADAFGPGRGQVVVVESGESCVNDDFIDPRDGTEHLNERGRRKIAGAIVARVKDVVS